MFVISLKAKGSFLISRSLAQKDTSCYHILTEKFAAASWK